MTISPDTKDWTWALTQACPDCGYDPTTVAKGDIAELVRAYTRPWPARLNEDDATRRPDPGTWSPTEYAAHVRDVCLLFAERLALMLTEDRPTFANWDQEATAIESDYANADPGVVAGEILGASEALSSGYADVLDSHWEREGLRSNGSEFTVYTLGVYALHDLAHHLADVWVSPR